MRARAMRPRPPCHASYANECSASWRRHATTRHRLRQRYREPTPLVLLQSGIMVHEEAVRVVARVRKNSQVTSRRSHGQPGRSFASPSVLMLLERSKAVPHAVPRGMSSGPSGGLGHSPRPPLRKPPKEGRMPTSTGMGLIGFGWMGRVHPRSDHSIPACLPAAASCRDWWRWPTPHGSRGSHTSARHGRTPGAA